MNLFNEAIYKNHLEHTAAGTKWGKHKYLYITPSGRYVYPEDVQNGKSAKEFRKQQINDQIKSAHQGSQPKSVKYGSTEYYVNNSKGYNSMGRKGTTLNTISSMDYQKKLKESTAKTSGTAAGSKSVATNSSDRNSISIKKTENASSTETKDNSKYKNMSEETKAWLEKEAAKGEKKEEDGKKKGSGNKKSGSGKKGSSGSSKKSSSKTERETASQTGGTTRAATEESKELGLTEEDLNNMEINTEATNRDEVIKNLALKVIRGDFGNGPERKEKLGKFYGEIQKRVNEMLKEKKVVKHYDLTEDSNYLMHWGKKRRSGRYAFGSGDRPYQHEPNKRYTRKNSSFSDRRRMTDEELLNAITRAKREVDLYRAERDNRSQGQRFVEDVLNSVGKAVIIGAATGGLKYAGKKFVESALGDQELANAMFGGGGGGKKKNKHKD